MNLMEDFMKKIFKVHHWNEKCTYSLSLSVMQLDSLYFHYINDDTFLFYFCWESI